MSPFLHTAIQAAKAAQAIIEKYYLGDFDIELKPDQSPVTAADIEAEETIRGLISEAFPEHGFYGEETGRHNLAAEYTWLIDPIDGTKSFVRGYPFFSTQIALMHQDTLVLGVSNAPAFGELAYAEQGLGAFLNGSSIQVSETSLLERATLSVGNLKTLAAAPQWAGLGDIVQDVNRFRGYGDFYHYHLLAAGKIDIVLESDVNILDIAALSVIVREAGGQFSDLAGRPLTLSTTSVLAANSAILHDAVLHRLKLV